MNKSIITLDIARKLIDVCYEKAKLMNLKVIISVVDGHGNLVAFNRMEGSLLVSDEISINKAWTAVALRMSTSDFAKRVQPGSDLYGIENTNNNRLTPLGGGFPLYLNNETVGGIGVSGATAEEDMQIAQAAVDYYNCMK